MILMIVLYIPIGNALPLYTHLNTRLFFDGLWNGYGFYHAYKRLEGIWLHIYKRIKFSFITILAVLGIDPIFLGKSPAVPVKGNDDLLFSHFA